MKIILFILCLSMAFFIGTWVVNKDSYLIDVPDPNLSLITWINDPIEVDKALRQRENELGYIRNGRITAMAQFNLENNLCTIWAYEPDGVDDSYGLIVLGHEALHCFRGTYHDF